MKCTSPWADLMLWVKWRQHLGIWVWTYGAKHVWRKPAWGHELERFIAALPPSQESHVIPSYAFWRVPVLKPKSACTWLADMAYLGHVPARIQLQSCLGARRGVEAWGWRCNVRIWGLGSPLGPGLCAVMWKHSNKTCSPCGSQERRDGSLWSTFPCWVLLFEA